jgi:hypothetical protein
VRLLASVIASAAAVVGPPHLAFRVYADTGIRLTGVLWTGSGFLYVENTTNTLWQAGPAGAPLRVFATMPNEVEETRCAISPGAHGFPAGVIYCHAPDGTIYRIAADGSSVDTFTRLPDTSTSDGGLAFDTVGRFGYALLAATGRSGGATPAGGTVFAIDGGGAVRTVGVYAGPGGADEIAVAPAHFGTAGGQAVLTVDAGVTGTIVLMDSSGRTRTVASLPAGPNPIAVVRARPPHAKTTPPPGLYVTDTNTHDVFHVPAGQLARYVGDLVVGAEAQPRFWIVRPRGKGFQTFEVPVAIPGSGLNLEGAVYIPG